MNNTAWTIFAKFMGTGYVWAGVVGVSFVAKSGDVQGGTLIAGCVATGFIWIGKEIMEVFKDGPK